MEFSKHNWATISETICPEKLIFGKQASWTLFFQIIIQIFHILSNPIISEIPFNDVITLVLYRQVFEGEGKGGKLDARDRDGCKATPLN